MWKAFTRYKHKTHGSRDHPEAVEAGKGVTGDPRAINRCPQFLESDECSLGSSANPGSSAETVLGLTMWADNKCPKHSMPHIHQIQTQIGLVNHWGKSTVHSTLTNMQKWGQEGPKVRKKKPSSPHPSPLRTQYLMTSCSHAWYWNHPHEDKKWQWKDEYSIRGRGGQQKVCVHNMLHSTGVHLLNLSVLL